MDAREIELPVVDLGRRPPIRPEMTVRQVVADDPGCREVFRRHGESEGCPTRFGHLEPLDRFARRHGAPLDALLAELSSAGATFSSACSAALRGPSHPSTGGWLGLLGLAGLAGLLRRSDPMHRRTNDGTRWTT